MNIKQLRQSLKEKWLTYYSDNREWLVQLGVWVDYDGARRPSSSFILATLSVLEPRLTRLMPLVVELNSHPDRIVTALGLNFSPDDVIVQRIQSEEASPLKLLPGSELNQWDQTYSTSTISSADLSASDSIDDTGVHSAIAHQGNGQRSVPSPPSGADERPCPKSNVVRQDERCSGRQGDTDEDIWR